MSLGNDNGAGLLTAEEVKTLSRLGRAVYERLRPAVEPGNEGKYIALHVDTEEYAIGSTATEARRLLRARREPNGRMHTQKIGDEPDYSLASVMLTGQVASGSRK